VVLQVATSLEPLQRASRAVLARLLATALLGALATLVGGWWLAASSVRPVREIAAQAGAITGTVADQRITMHADVVEFESLIAVLNAMLARLERAASWHQRVVRDLGHDLRTPIAAMRTGVELALWTERTPDEYRRVLASTLEEIERLTLISDALITMGRLASGHLVAQPVALDARAVAAEAVRHAQQRISGHRVSLVTDGAVPVQGDARLLGMVLEQLLDNGMRHTPAGTPVTICVGLEDGHAQLVVEDRGPGVPDEVLPHLFEPFYRGDTARGREAGPGLGLTLAAAIVELHHGTIRGERSEAGGLRVRIRLPKNPVAAPEFSPRA
jgi:signal transduction histidine kinase